MPATKILLVDDDEMLLRILHNLLEHEGFEVAVANSVAKALKLISSERYDMLLSDLHMPGAGDGLTVISAMRHVNPECVAMLLTSFPEMDVAAQAVMRQADEILLKQTDFAGIISSVKRRLAEGIAHVPPRIESVATILERSARSCIDDWFFEVQRDERLTRVPLTREERCSHLSRVFRDLVARLQATLPLGSRGPLSAGASDHGLARRRLGYTAAMMVEESRILQVCIFHTLQKNLEVIDFSVLLYQVMTIADEVDSQLRQATECFVDESIADSLLA
jgi:ActR/RegA family two-component response regulator